jgi:hypothetical protein
VLVESDGSAQALPTLSSWAEEGKPLRLIQKSVAKDDLDPKAIYADARPLDGARAPSETPRLLIGRRPPRPARYLARTPGLISAGNARRRSGGASARSST